MNVKPLNQCLKPLHFCLNTSHPNVCTCLAYILIGSPDVWKLHFATPDWIPGTEGCRYLCRCEQVNWHDVPLLYNIGRDPSEKVLCTVDNLCEPLTSEEDYHRVVTTIQESVEKHRETVDDSVTNQYSVFRLIPRPWLQPCCNFPNCQCTESKGG